MKRGRVLALLVGGVFCLAVMSLYRMLEMMQGAGPDQVSQTPYRQVDEVCYQVYFLFWGISNKRCSQFKLLVEFHNKITFLNIKQNLNYLFFSFNSGDVRSSVNRCILINLTNKLINNLRTDHLFRIYPTSSRRSTGWSVSSSITITWSLDCET